MSRKGKKFAAAFGLIDRTKLYDLEEAIALSQKAAFAKFDESVDAAVKLGVDPRHSDQMVRGAVVLPNGTGKTVRIAVFAKGDKAKEAEAAGADIVGGDELVTKVEGGYMDFDKVVATPDMMAKVGKLGKVLGPRGLMPNPKVGTVTNDVAKAVKELKAGMVEFRVDKAGIVNAPIGRKNFETSKLVENMKTLVDALVKVKPASSKGIYLRGINISTTMGPGVKVDPKNF